MAVSTAEASTEAVYVVDLEQLPLPGPQPPVQLVQAPLVPPARKAPTWAAAAQEANSASVAGLALVP
jgi:hypothetical protein